MAQYARNRNDRSPRLYGERRYGVTEVVRSDRQAQCSRSGIEAVASKIAISQRRAVRGGKRRIVPLIPGIMAMLKSHKVTQAAGRLRAGDQWRDFGLVFTTELGTPSSPATRSGWSRPPRAQPGSRTSACIRCGTARRSRGSNRVCISRRSRICSGTPRSASRATCTGTPHRHRSPDGGRIARRTARAVIDTPIRAVVIGIAVQGGRQLVTGRHSAPA